MALTKTECRNCGGRFYYIKDLFVFPDPEALRRASARSFLTTYQLGDEQYRKEKRFWGVCSYCGSITEAALSESSDERHEKALKCRRHFDFKGAMGIYENILYEDANDCKAEWFYALSKHGVAGESEDELFYFNVPPHEPFESDVNYKQLCDRISGHSAETSYRRAAKKLDDIRTRYLEIQKIGKEYGVCLCVPSSTSEQGAALKAHISEERKDVSIFVADPNAKNLDAEFCYAVHNSKVLVILGGNVNDLEGNAKNRFLKPFSARDGVMTVVAAGFELSEEYRENANTVDINNADWISSVMSLIENKLPKPKVIVKEKTIINNVSEIHIKENLDHACDCFINKQYKEAYGSAEKVLQDLPSCPTAEYVKAFYLAVVQNTVHRNALNSFFKSYSGKEIDTDNAERLKKLFSASVYYLADYEECAVRMIVNADLSDAGTFADAFCSRLVAKRKDSKFLTPSLTALYTELASKYTMPKLCLALISSTKTNPDSPIHGNSFHLKTKASFFRENYFIPIGKIIENMKDTGVRAKYSAVWQNELSKYDAKLK